MKTPIARVVSNTLRLSNYVDKADSNRDGKLSADEVAAGKAALPSGVQRRFQRAVNEGGGTVQGAQNALSNAAMKVFQADRNHDGFISGKERQTLDKGGLATSLLNRSDSARTAGLEGCAFRAGQKIGEGLSPEKLARLEKHQGPVAQAAVAAWKQGGGTVEGARAQLTAAVREVAAADADHDGRLSPTEAAGLSSEVARALYAATINLHGRW